MWVKLVKAKAVVLAAVFHILEFSYFSLLTEDNKGSHLSGLDRFLNFLSFRAIFSQKCEKINYKLYEVPRDYIFFPDF